MTALTHRSVRGVPMQLAMAAAERQRARLILAPLKVSTASPDLLRLFTRAGLPRANSRLNPQDDESHALFFRPHLLSSRIILVASLLFTGPPLPSIASCPALCRPWRPHQPSSGRLTPLPPSSVASFCWL